MVYSHFNRTHKYFPTPNEILHGLILAQIDEFMINDYETMENFKPIFESHTEIWLKLFDLAKVEKMDMDKPLTAKILSDPKHPFVMRMLYIYSMQSFVFEQTNKVSRDKDVSKIEFYGPFASAFSFIIHNGSFEKASI